MFTDMMASPVSHQSSAVYWIRQQRSNDVGQWGRRVSPVAGVLMIFIYHQMRPELVR